MRSTARGCAAPCSATSAWALHHKLCHTLGGSFNLPHAEVHTVVLPHALAYNAAAAPEAMARIARALGAGRPRARAACFDLARDHGAPIALRDIGMPADGPGPRRRPRGAATRTRTRGRSSAARDPRAAATRLRRRSAALTRTDLCTTDNNRRRRQP